MNQKAQASVCELCRVVRYTVETYGPQLPTELRSELTVRNDEVKAHLKQIADRHEANFERVEGLLDKIEQPWLPDAEKSAGPLFEKSEAEEKAMDIVAVTETPDEKPPADPARDFFAELTKGLKKKKTAMVLDNLHPVCVAIHLGSEWASDEVKTLPKDPFEEFGVRVARILEGCPEVKFPPKPPGDNWSEEEWIEDVKEAWALCWLVANSPSLYNNRTTSELCSLFHVDGHILRRVWLVLDIVGVPVVRINPDLTDMVDDVGKLCDRWQDILHCCHDYMRGVIDHGEAVAGISIVSGFHASVAEKALELHHDTLDRMPVRGWADVLHETLRAGGGKTKALNSVASIGVLKKAQAELVWETEIRAGRIGQPNGKKQWKSLVPVVEPPANIPEPEGVPA